MLSDKTNNPAQTLSREAAASLIQRLGEEAGMPDMKLDGEGSVWFADPDGNMHGLIHLENRPGLLLLAGMPATVVRSAAALDVILRANLDATASGGGVFGRVSGRDEPFLMVMVPAEASDVDGLSEHLDAFFDLAAEWREELDGPEYEPGYGGENAAAQGPEAGQTV